MTSQSIALAAWEFLVVGVVFYSLAAATSEKSTASNLQQQDQRTPRACTPPHDQYPFCDTSLLLEERMEDLISKLTLEEKPYLLTARESPRGNISRLGLPEYDWGTNCLHGVQSRCLAVVVAGDPYDENNEQQQRCPTSFPMPNVLGATFNRTIWRRMGHVMGLELRALWLQGVGENHYPNNLPHVGLDCWSPNINLGRDPRWGRNLETPGEDPFLSGTFAVEQTLGLQNNSDLDPRYLQAVVTLKHFIANSLEGPYWTSDGQWDVQHGSLNRHTVNAKISMYDLETSYYPAFRMAIQQGGAAGIMCSYNRINGVPACAHEQLLQKVVREQWHFRGYVTSDSGAIDDIRTGHHYTQTWNKTVARAVQAGCDVESSGVCTWATGSKYIDYLPDAVRAGWISEAVVDRALKHALDIRFRLGLFDPIDDQPLWQVPPEVVHDPHHVQLSKEATAQGMVLLKDDAKLLPLNIDSKIALIGPHVDNLRAMVGNYLGQICPGTNNQSCLDSFEKGFLQVVHGSEGVVRTSMGCDVAGNDTIGFHDAIQAASRSDVVVFLGGLNLTLENESRDRPDIGLPDIQVDLIRRLSIVNSNVVLVLLHGGMVGLDDVLDYAKTIVSVGYPGPYGGTVLPRLMYGLEERGWGKTTVTWYRNSIVEELNMVDFDMGRAPGRTYRYYTGVPHFGFGTGLNPLTDFQIGEMIVAGLDCMDSLEEGEILLPRPCKTLNVSVSLSNVGQRAGEEVLMAFFVPLEIPKSEPASKLREQMFEFERVHLRKGESIDVSFSVHAKTLQLANYAGQPITFAGTYQIKISTGMEYVSKTVFIGQDGSLQLVNDLKTFQIQETHGKQGIK